MAKYTITNKAKEDLGKIWNYTFDEWSEKQADKYFNLLTESFEEISINPYIGKNYEGIVKSLFGMRVGKHIVFYRIINPEEIEITRILHEMMDLKKRICE